MIVSNVTLAGRARKDLRFRLGAGLIGLAWLVAVHHPVSAEPVALQGEGLRDAVSGATVEIDTPLGTTVPVKFAADGSVTGEAGEVASYLGAEHDQGRWWIEHTQLCQRWATWFHGEKTCLRIERDGNKIAWQRTDGENGTATLFPRLPIIVTASDGPRSALGGPIPLAVPEPAAVEPESPPQTSIALVAPAPAPVAVAPVAIRPALAKSKQAAKTRHKAVKAAAPPAAPAVTFWVHGVDDDDVLNVRQGPSADTEVVGAIPPQGHGIRITGGCVELWCPVRFDKISGWVNRSFLVYEVPAVAGSSAVAAAR